MRMAKARAVARRGPRPAWRRQAVRGLDARQLQAESGRPAEPPTLRADSGPIKVDVSLVLVSVSVVDPLNREVVGLNKEDFEVFEGKEKQAIRHFSSEDTPLSLGIIFDASGSMADKIDRGERVGKEAAALKNFATRTAREVTSNALQVCGAYGLTADMPLLALYRDAKIGEVFGGVAEIQRIIVARDSLNEVEASSG